MSETRGNYINLNRKERYLSYSWVWAFVSRAVVVAIPLGAPSSWHLTFVGCSMLIAFANEL